MISVVLFLSWEKRIFPYTAMAVVSESMSPDIVRGDLIILKKAERYEVGDVITFYVEHRKEYITHRINRIEDGRIYTKGDANEAEDDYISSESDILGRQVSRISYVGHIIIFLRTIRGIIVCMVVPAAIFLGIILSDFGRSFKMMVEKNKN